MKIVLETNRQLINLLYHMFVNFQITYIQLVSIIKYENVKTL